VGGNASDTESLILMAGGGDAAAMGELFDRFRSRLRTLVRLRMDRKLQGRVDPSDILQETYLEAAQRIGKFAQERTMPFFLWLRFLAAQRLMISHRRHLGTKKRGAEGEVSIHGNRVPHAETGSLADQLLGTLTGPDAKAIRGEMRGKLQEALESMDAMDREVLTMRHFEQLSNSEVALALEISKTAASNRYVRALDRLREILTELGIVMD
jgi:RNA polymerase sigma-70 factor (ECF subfamily)